MYLLFDIICGRTIKPLYKGLVHPWATPPTEINKKKITYEEDRSISFQETGTQARKEFPSSRCPGHCGQ